MSIWSRLNPLNWGGKSYDGDVLALLRGGQASRTGLDVNWKTALEVSTVLRCAGVIADGIATVPLRLYRKDARTGRRAAAMDHPLYEVLHNAPNEWQDSLEFRETLAFHAVLTGNAYGFISRVRGRVAELIPMDPARVEVKQEADWRMRYWFTDASGQRQELPPEAVWHIRGPSWNGYTGLNAVRLAREAIGLSLALEGSHASLHRNGVRSSGAWSIDGALDDKQYRRLRAMIAETMAGVENTGRPFVLDRSAKWTPLAMSGVDAQHLETRRHQIEEICRFMGVMPIMVGYSDKAATYASAEQMFLAHAVHTVRPWHRRFEASIRRNLLTDEERAAGLYPKFIDTELLRGAAKDRGEYYARGIAAGWLTRNEAREWEELDPIDGLSEPLAPLNMTVGNPPAPE
jgi:HK97 family phage portal protein